MNKTAEQIQTAAANKSLQSHYDKGYDTLCYFREKGITDIPTREWYKKRFNTEEEYKVWLSYKFTYSDVSDEYFNSLSPYEQNKFRKTEQRKWKYGIWNELPSFTKLSPVEKEYQRSLNPFAGRIQVLPGAHYFLLNYIPVDIIGSEDGIGRANYYRRDSMVLDIIESLHKYTLPPLEDREWLLYFKARGTHFTTTMDAYIVKNMISEKQFKCMATIDVEEKIQRTGDSIATMYHRTPNWIQSFKPTKKEPQSLLSRIPGDKQQYGLKLEKWNYELNEIDKTIKSTVLVRIPKPKKFEQERADFIFGDEVNLYEHNITEVIGKARGTLIGSERQKIGMMVMGGVSDNNNHNLSKFKVMSENPSAYKCMVLFSGVQHYQLVDANGWTPEPDIIKRELDVCQLKKQSGDLDEYVLYKTQNPISIKDCFFMQGNNLLDIDEVNAHVNEVTQDLKLGKIHNTRGWLRAGHSSLYPEFHPDPNGGWYILEFPDESVKHHNNPTSDYVAASDNVDAHITDSEAEMAVDGRGKRSLQAMVIGKTSTKEVIALYLYRHADPRLDFQQKLLGCIWYNCRNLPEKNKPGELNYFQFESDYGYAGYPPGYFKKYLKMTPIRYGVSSSKATPYGIDTMKNKVMLYKDYYIPYVKENLKNIKILRLLEDISNWEYVESTYSPDSCMALLIFTVHLHEASVFEEKKTLIQNRNGLYKPREIPRPRYIGGRLTYN